MTSITQPAEWLPDPRHFHGDWEGATRGANISVISNDVLEPGRGPRLHKHPYPETFVIRRGRALFVVGDETVEAHSGQILVVPPDTPHKFTNLGPEPLETIDIHESGSFVTEWLE